MLATIFVTVGAGVVTMNLPADVVFVPPAAVTLRSYVPTAIPEGTTSPVMEVALATVYVVIGVVPKTTADTVLAEEPPKKPAPVTATVVGVKLLPVPAVMVATVGAEVVTMNLPAEVVFVPPAAVTLRS